LHRQNLAGEIMAASKARKRPASKARVKRRPLDAIALLRADHAKVEALFEQFQKAREAARKQKLAQLICMELTLHTAIEEEIFYPAARAALPKEEDLLDEAEVEHASAKELIAQIEAGAPGDDKWEAKVMVLAEYIKHHVKEEHTEMFPKVRKTKLDLRALGRQLQQRKEELSSAGSREGLMRRVARAVSQAVPA
jgi:hemerythrin superfamily protein